MYKLLIIDDEPLVRRGICTLVDFDALNISEVYEAANGFEGLELFTTHSPDLVLVDINMPKMNGLEFAEQAKKINSSARIAILTGYNYFDYAVSALKIGVEDYILKPVSKEDVSQILVKLIAKLETSHQHKAVEQAVSALLQEHEVTSETAYKEMIQNKIFEQLSDSNLSLISLASELGFSSGYLSSLFKKELGVSFQDYVLNQRLDKAKLLLLSSEMKNYEIAKAVGFEDVNYFGTRFKIRFGLSPKQYKEMVLGERR